MTKTYPFRAEDSDIAFEAALESYAAPESSYWQWVRPLPPELRTPLATFYSTRAPGLYVLQVCSRRNDSALIEREDGAVLCQIIGIATQEAIGIMSNKTQQGEQG